MLHVYNELHSFSHLASRFICCSLQVLLTVTLLAAPIAAQTNQAPKQSADRLMNEAEQLLSDGRKESLEQARDKLLAAIPLFHAASDGDDEATALANVGYICNDLGERQRAISFYNQALLLRRTLRDRSGEALMLNNIGSVYSALGEKQKALELYKQALSLSRSAGDQKVEGATLHNIGRIYDVLGEKQKALDTYTQALPLFRAVSDRQGEAVALNSIGSIYNDLGERKQALDFYAQSFSLSRAAKDYRTAVTTVGNIAAVYNALGDKEKALAYYNQGLVLNRALGNRSGEASMLHNMGVVFSGLGDKQKALNYFSQALPLRRAVGDRYGEGVTLHDIGTAYDALGEKQKAFDYMDQALTIHRAIGDRRGEAATLNYLAYLERDRGNLAEALTNIENALVILESLRGKIGSLELRSSFFATVQDSYKLYIDLLMRMHRQKPADGYDGKALQASERGRARSLLEMLGEANADIRQGVDAALLARERALQQQLDLKAHEQIQLLGGPHTERQTIAVAKEIESLTTQFQQTEAQIRQTSPHYAALTQPQPLTLREIQTQVLDADTLLLEYSLGDDHSYLWAVTPTSITSYELPKRAEIEAAAREFYAFLNTAPQRAARSAPADRGLGLDERQPSGRRLAEAGVRLSQMLLTPVSTLLGNKRLVVVSDGALQYIPFAALPVPAGDANNTQTLPLIVQHEVISLPSASTLLVLRHEAIARKGATKMLAVFADPVFERTDERFQSSARQPTADATTEGTSAGGTRGLGLAVHTAAEDSGAAPAGLRIPRLPATRREAEEISKLAPTAALPDMLKVSLDFAANRAAAIDSKLGDYRFVHFATHGFLDSQHPELSGILLSLFDEHGMPQDGFLRAHEVFNLKLSADVVVLSACQTGLGKEVKGEGLIGLTRGFMYAGAPRVVVSLWSVNDAATAELMTRFYRGMLVDKLRPAQALKAAQVSMLHDKRFGDPFYWAAFTLQGEWR
jgi:CHAT domain-containing protein/Flp pilus assembly protein TadD